jgi:hypothetical protein
MSSTESVPTGFIHFLPRQADAEPLEGPETMLRHLSAESLNTTASFMDELVPFPNYPSNSRPTTRHRTPESMPSSTVLFNSHSKTTTTWKPPGQDQDPTPQLHNPNNTTLHCQLLRSFRNAKAEIFKLGERMREISSSFDSERSQLEGTIGDLQAQVRELKMEKGSQRDSYAESLQEIENKSHRLTEQLTNALFENSTLR